MISIEDFVDRVLPVLAVFMFVVMFGVLIALLVYLPFQLATHAECLRNGYPKSTITIGLERYCMNLEGTVTIKVDRISK